MQGKCDEAVGDHIHYESGLEIVVEFDQGTITIKLILVIALLYR